jgi:hypothetical protein
LQNFVDVSSFSTFLKNECSPQNMVVVLTKNTLVIAKDNQQQH